MNNINSMNYYLGNKNNILVRYGNYGYPYNISLVLFYDSNMYNSPS